MKIVCIYKIISPSGKIYIGQTHDFKRRIIAYRGNWIKYQVKLYNSFKKYGFERHIISIIHELPLDITQDVLNTYETLYWELYKDCGFEMLNTREPGSNGKMSEESKRKMAISQKGNKNASKKRTKEQIERNRQAKLGKINSPDLMQKLWDGNKKAIIEITSEGDFVKDWPSIIDAANFYAICPKRIGDILHNRKKRIKGFNNKFKFKNYVENYAK